MYFTYITSVIHDPVGMDVPYPWARESKWDVGTIRALDSAPLDHGVVALAQKILK